MHIILHKNFVGCSVLLSPLSLRGNILRPNTKNLLIWGVIFATLIGMANFFTNQTLKQNTTTFNYSEFISELKKGSISEVQISGPNISGKIKGGKAFVTYAPYNPLLLQELLDRDVVVTAKPMEQEFSFWQFLSWAPIILIGIMIFFAAKQMQAGNNKAMNFGRSKAKMATEKKVKITFDDVAGVDEAKQELEEVVEFLKDPTRFQRLGGKIPKGFLLVGPPGTGKTLLAKAIAGEAGVPFYSIAGSDFVEVFVGIGASRVRDLFDQAKKNNPCIVFIDEIDAVGRHRGAGFGGGNDEREQTLNQLLVEMDGFEEHQTIIVIAATNRPDVLDNALLRPGRFDRRVVVPNPDLKGREAILKVHVKKVPLTPDVDIAVIARGTPGFSGADLANLVNESALLAARRGKLAVGMKELEEAKDKVMMGAERRSMVLTNDAKTLTAFHEAGHALVAFYTPGSDPLHKATIIPRGNALGMVVSLPENDRVSMTRESVLANVMMSMGGRIAEETIFGLDKVTTGAASDIKTATNIVRRMVMEWGMSDRIGFQNCAQESTGYGLEPKEFSESTAQIIDEEVRSILTTCYEKVDKLIREHRKELENLAHAMLERETLTGEEIKLIFDGKELPPFVRASGSDNNKATVGLPIVQEATVKKAKKTRTIAAKKKPEES